MSDSYTTAALRGLGMEDESYTSAALRGFGDESYTDAALRGMGKFKKGSPEAKAFMARLRAMRSSKGGKRLKGGIAFSTVAAALGLIPTAIKGAHAIYKWIKGSGILKSKGGHAIILDANDRRRYLEGLREVHKGREIGGLSPYTMAVAPGKASKRQATVNKEILDYLSSNGLLEDAIMTATSWKNAVSAARKALGLKSAYVKKSSSRASDIDWGDVSSTRRKRKRPRIRVTEEPIDIPIDTSTTTRRKRRRPRIRVTEEPIDPMSLADLPDGSID